jgi:hypothetical protein
MGRAFTGLLTNSTIQEVFEPLKRLDPSERSKLIEEKTARMKASIKAKREKEADEKLQAEREQRRKSLAPHWEDSSDDDDPSGLSMDMGSSLEKDLDTPLQEIKKGKEKFMPIEPKISAPAGHSNTPRVPAEAVKPEPSFKALQVNQKARAASLPTRKISNLSIDTQRKRSYDVMSNSNSSSRRGSKDDSPLFERLSSTNSPASAVSPAAVLLSGMSRISKKRKTSIPDQASPASASSTSVQDLGIAALPEWYLKAKAPVGHHALSSWRKLWDQLDHLKVSVKACENAANPEERTAAVNKVSELLHSLEFFKVNAFALSKYKMLHEGQGLKKIAEFHQTSFNFPWYLRADAQELYNKWLNRQWDPDMFRGIKNMIKGKETKGGQSIDEKHKLDWRFFGEGNFVVGQWWANQICAVRDGAHGSAQAGIAGIKTTTTTPGGATSIVLSEGHKEDVDDGEEIWYCGTETKIGDTEPTTSTKFMLESVRSGHPVRVLRSSGLSMSNKYRPVKGFRYDGLYEVLSSKIIDRLKHHYLFHLKRLPGQIDLRWEGEAARPTKRELQEYEAEMRKYGRRKSLA